MTLREELRSIKAASDMEARARTEWAPRAFEAIKLSAQQTAAEGCECGTFEIVSAAATPEALLLQRKALHRLLEEEELQSIKFSDDNRRVSFCWV